MKQFRCFLLLALACVCTPAFAQTVNNVVPSPGLEEIIVTARKRAEIAQDVPIALSVVTEKDLQDARAVSVEDLSRTVPNLQIVNTGAAGSYTAVARGITNLVSTPESTSVLGVYVDEAPVSAFGASIPDAALFDIERVEFLRGPQGTLFGEGSEAGTIRLITNKPDSHAFSAKFEGTDYGTRDGANSWNGRGAVNIPLVADQLAARIVGSFRDDGGWINVPEIGRKDSNQVKESDVRAAVRWTPSGTVTADLSWTHDHLLADDAFLQTSDGVYRPSTLGPLIAGVSAGPVRQASPNKYDYDLANAAADIDFGFADLVSSTSYFKQHGSSLEELSPVVPPYLVALGHANLASAPGMAQQTSSDLSELLSDELRLVSKGDEALSYTVGAFFRRQERKTNQDLAIALLVPPLPLANELALENTTDNAYALFGQLDYKLLPTLTASAGVRYYHDKRDTETTTIAAPAAPPSVTSPNASDHAVSPNFILDLHPDARVSLYAKAARGFRQGGTNGASAFDPTIPKSYGPESLWSYELGAKSTPLPWLTSNVYLFYNNWDQLQVSAVKGFFGFTQNGGKARSEGVEGEFFARPTENWTFGLNVSYTDSKITSVSPEAAAAGLMIGAHIPYVPQVSANVYGEYRQKLSGDFSGFGRVEYEHRNKTFSDDLNTLDLQNNPVDRVNLRAGLIYLQWRVTVFAENLTNADDTSSRSYILLPTYITQVPMRPRTVGITVGTAF